MYPFKNIKVCNKLFSKRKRTIYHTAELTQDGIDELWTNCGLKINEGYTVNVTWNNKSSKNWKVMILGVRWYEENY